MRITACLLAVALFAPGVLAGPAELVKELGSGDPQVRAEARDALTAAGEAAVPALLDGLASGDAVSSVLCADLLAATGHRSARRPLREILEADGTSMLLRRACCRALGRVGDYRDLELLAGLIQTLPEAAVAIAEIGEPEGLELVAAVAGDDAAPEVWYALASLGDERGIEGLLARIEGPRSLVALHYLRRIAGTDAGTTAVEWRRWWAGERLALRLGDEDWDASELALARVRKNPTPEVLEDLLAIATDGDRIRSARTKALLALGLVGGPDSAPDILRILQTDRDGQVRVYAAEALGRLAVPETAVDLAYYLIFDEERFRKLSAKDTSEPYFTIDSAVCNALIHLGVAGGLDYMILQLSQQHRIRVYHEALRTLRSVTGQNFGYLPDANRKERAAAAARWRKWFDEHRGELDMGSARLSVDSAFRERVAQQVETLGHFQFLSMSRARKVLGILGKAALPELIAGLDRPETHIRVHCAEVLGWSHLIKGRAALAARVNVPNAEVRTAVVAALADMGPGEFADAVIAALEDEDPDVRIEAARAMALVDPDVAGLLLEAEMKKSSNAGGAFQREALTALAKHGDADAVSRLSDMLSSPDAATRQWVADRLLLLTGRNPGVDAESIAGWREWWKVARERYSRDGLREPNGDGAATGG